MGESRHQGLGATLIVVGGILVVGGTLVMLWASDRPQYDQTLPSSAYQRARALADTLGLSLALVLGFLGGSFLLVRLGRRLFAPLRTKSPAMPYVDVWANYRLTDQQIREATQEPEDRNPPPARPHDSA